MHFFILILSALTSIVSIANAKFHIQAIQPNRYISSLHFFFTSLILLSPNPIKYEQDLQGNKCTSFESIWRKTPERVDEMHFTSDSDYHIIFYRQADCKGDIHTDEVGYIPNARQYELLNTPVSVALTDRGTTLLEYIDQYFFDNGKTPDRSISYPADKDKVKAFKVVGSMCRGSAAWTHGYVPFAHCGPQKEEKDD